MTREAPPQRLQKGRRLQCSRQANSDGEEPTALHVPSSRSRIGSLSHFPVVLCSGISQVDYLNSILRELHLSMACISFYCDSHDWELVG
jgi:hypothetical protein